MSLFRRRTARRRPMTGRAVETLDARVMLAGTVSVFHHPRLLTLTGDEADNDVEVQVSADGTQATLTGFSGTTFNVEGGATGVPSVTIDFEQLVTFRAKMHGGADTLTVSGFGGATGSIGSAAIDMGAGLNDVELSNITASKFVTVSGGADADFIRLVDVQSTGAPGVAAVRVRGLAGDDNVQIDGLDAPDQRFVVTLNAGDEIFEADSVSVSEVRFFGGHGAVAVGFNDLTSSGDVLLSTRNENDVVGIGNFDGRSSIGGDLTIASRNGDDSIGVASTTVAGQTRIITGRDDDVVALNRNEDGEANRFMQDIRVFNDHGRMDVYSVGRQAVDGVLRVRGAGVEDRFLTDSLFEGDGGAVIQNTAVSFEQPFEDAFGQARYAQLEALYSDLSTLLDCFLPLDYFQPFDGFGTDASSPANPVDAASQFLYDFFSVDNSVIVTGTLGTGDTHDAYFYDFAPDDVAGAAVFGLQNFTNDTIRLRLFDEAGAAVGTTVISAGQTGTFQRSLSQLGGRVTVVVQYLGDTPAPTTTSYGLAAWRA